MIWKCISLLVLGNFGQWIFNKFSNRDTTVYFYSKKKTKKYIRPQIYIFEQVMLINIISPVPDWEFWYFYRFCSNIILNLNCYLFITNKRPQPPWPFPIRYPTLMYPALSLQNNPQSIVILYEITVLYRSKLFFCPSKKCLQILRIYVMLITLCDILCQNSHSLEINANVI